MNTNILYIYVCLYACFLVPELQRCWQRVNVMCGFVAGDTFMTNAVSASTQININDLKHFALCSSLRCSPHTSQLTFLFFPPNLISQF